jgi:hypothetical protein
MAVEQQGTLQQGNCKNAFCQGILPPDEITIIKPPIGDPDAKKDEYWLLKQTLYGLRSSPQHWYIKIKSILEKLGLHQNAYNPCLFSGHVVDPSDSANTPSSAPLTLGLYIDNFVHFSSNSEIEAKFQCLLMQHIKVNFMGMVEWFLGTHFQWSVTPPVVKVHLSQTGFVSHLVEENNIYHRNITLDATPYWSGLLIDACPGSDKDKESPGFLKRRHKYQSIVGSIRWLAQSTRPDLTPLHSFLSVYNNKPSRSHMNAALYGLHYIHSTIDYGFTFTFKLKAPLHTCMLFPHPSDTEAYHDALPPKLGSHHCLTMYSDACWGSQIGNAIQEGIQLPLFKFRSMSSAILFCSGGPLTWKADQQECTSLSSCEAKIRATNMGSCLTLNTRNMILHLSACGYPINDASFPTPIYNDNEACIKWCHNMTSKSDHHIELQENITREWVNKGAITVSHISGKSNPTNIFTKDMRDGAIICKLWDSFMCRGSAFLKSLHTSTLPIPNAMASDPSHIAQSVHCIPPSAPGTLEVLLSHALLHTLAALSCLTHAG